MTFRKTIFWLHLPAGVLAGLFIFGMCFTGTVLSFAKQIIAWAERDVRRVQPAEPATRLSLAALQRHVKAARPESRPTGIVVSADPAAAVVFPLGQTGALYANPYTGAVVTATTMRTRDFMRTMENWHRWLAMSGDNRSFGRSINGACNGVFCVVVVTGLYLWWPRKWRTKGLRRSLWFVRRPLDGKARDWNWHNVIGLWSAPVLLVLTLTALPISYRWADNLIYTMVGERAPAPAGPPSWAAAAVALPGPSVGDRPLEADALLRTVQRAIPHWAEITLDLGDDGPCTSEPQAISVEVWAPDAWPRTAVTTFTLNPHTAELLRRETFADLTLGQRMRTWSRDLHTGEALGDLGQLIAGLASLGGCVLVYTGFALSWRRFARWRKSRTT